MLRRKQDPQFRNIDFIKNFIGVDNEDKSIVVAKYNRSDCLYQELLQRAKTLMRVFGENIIPSEPAYITREE